MSVNGAKKECKFKESCGGGHSTAQHWLHVYERRIGEQCGYEAYYELKEAVDRDAASEEAGK